MVVVEEKPQRRETEKVGANGRDDDIIVVDVIVVVVFLDSFEKTCRSCLSCRGGCCGSSRRQEQLCQRRLFSARMLGRERTTAAVAEAEAEGTRRVNMVTYAEMMFVFVLRLRPNEL